MTDDKWLMTDDKWLMTNDWWQMTDWQWLISSDWWLTSYNQWLMTYNWQPMTDDHWPKTRKLLVMLFIYYKVFLLDYTTTRKILLHKLIAWHESHLFQITFLDIKNKMTQEIFLFLSLSGLFVILGCIIASIIYLYYKRKSISER